MEFKNEIHKGKITPPKTQNMLNNEGMNRFYFDFLLFSA